jgi:hypothetical protein
MYGAACSMAPADLLVLKDVNVDAMIFEMVDYMFHRMQSTSVAIFFLAVVAMRKMGMPHFHVNAMTPTNVINNIVLACSMGRAKTAIALVVHDDLEGVCVACQFLLLVVERRMLLLYDDKGKVSEKRYLIFVV